MYSRRWRHFSPGLVAHLSEKEAMTMSDEQTYQDAYNRRVKQEHVEFENNPIARAQRELDFHWQCRLDDEAAARAELDVIEVGGFLERRRPSCHRSRRDSDWYLR
jgi:hypothetical protein